MSGNNLNKCLVNKPTEAEYNSYLKQSEYLQHHNKYYDCKTIKFMRKDAGAYVELCIEDSEPETVYIVGLSVSEKYRRKGVATKLLEELIFNCRYLGCTNICLTVLKDSWMQEWYMRLGFENPIECEDTKYVWLLYKRE